MPWFDTSNASINRSVTLQEDENVKWFITFDRATSFSIDLQRQDGEGPDLYVIEEKEYNNFRKGLIFKYITDLSYKNIERFSSQAVLSRGRYYVIVVLPRMQDGYDAYSVFNIRYEALQ